MFANAYAIQAGDAGLPLYLQPPGQAALLRLGIGERMHLHTGNVLTAAPELATQVGGFDLISLSNIADWMDDAQFDAVVRDLKVCLTAGGALPARTVTERGPCFAHLQLAIASSGCASLPEAHATARTQAAQILTAISLAQTNNDAASFIWCMPAATCRCVRNTQCARIDALCAKCLSGIAHCTIDVPDLSILFRLGLITITTAALCSA